MNVAGVQEEPSSFINCLPTNNRRRSLFPSEISDSETDSDLGHISPLNFDSSFEHEDFIQLHSKQNQNNMESYATVGDYDILGIVENQNTQETMSPLYLSPYYKKSHPSETPSKTSPTFKLKTPHDAPNTNVKFPKLSRKSLLDSSEVVNKRKLSPDNSPEPSKHIKLDLKPSRVRTTLFPEVDFALSTKLFYSNTQNKMEKIVLKREPFPKSSASLNVNRKPQTRKKTGQINAGVRHKIRKPKAKKFKKSALANATLSAMDNTIINDYMSTLKQLQSSAEAPKLIQNKENKRPLLTPAKQIVPAITSPKKETLQSRKRSLSPDHEPDPNKKFFKFSKAKGIVKMHKTIQLEVNHGKMSLIEKNKNERKAAYGFDFDADEPELLKTDINNILSSLDNDYVPQENKMVLQAHSSVIASENSILLHQPKCPADLILSPISQMCDVTSGLALNTPKKVRNLTPILEEMIDGSSPKESKTLFPVFYPGAVKTQTKNEKKINGEKKIKKLPASQMLLDAGQKKFGLVECYECNTVYHRGDPNDEIMHDKYHTARHVLRFQGWKNERVVADFQHNGRIIQLLQGDSKLWWKKASELMHVINQEMGCYDMDFSLNNCQIFLYIKKKIIIGCLVAIAWSEGHKMLSATDSEVDYCSEQKFPIKCGIPRIWVSENYRKQGIATEMMNATKKHFILGYTLKNTDIAFSSPTDKECYPLDAKQHKLIPSPLLLFYLELDRAACLQACMSLKDNNVILFTVS